MKPLFTKRIPFPRVIIGFGFALLNLISTGGFGQTSYTWRPATVTDNKWSTALNWFPPRAVPAANDVLVFDGVVAPTATVIVDFDTNVGQTVGQLIFVNGVKAALSTDAKRILTIGTVSPAGGLQLGDALTTVQVTGTQGNNSSLTIKLASNVRAVIAGRLEFLGVASVASNSTHVLSSTTMGAIEFTSGSYFLAGLKFGGNPFGSATANSGTVVFDEGAEYEQASGASPFGDDPNFAITAFKPGSTFLYTATMNNIGLSNRTFGHLVIDNNRSPTATSPGRAATIENDLSILSGTQTFNIAGLNLKGNISFLNGASLKLNPDVNGVAGTSMIFNITGTKAQSISGNGALITGSNVGLTLNNAAGLTLQCPLQVNGALTLTNGLLTTTTANSLTLGPAVAATIIGSATSFVNGPLNRLQTGTAVNLTFPIGSGNAYRPLTLTGQQADAATTYTAQQFNQAPAARTFPTAAGSVQRVSKVRYFNVTNNGATNFTQGKIIINYGIDDKVDAPDKLRLAKSDNAGNWLDLGGMGTVTPMGSIASTVPFTSFSDFVLASTEANGTPGNNPLPVSLTGFTAQRQAAGVRLDWATASELNNSRFEVQRSADGQTFATLTTVLGSGSSTAAHAYNWLDAGPAGGPLYYRLRQVDADGTETYSPVVTVLPDMTQPGVFPNPAQQHINFGAPAGSAYRVLNVLGQEVLAGRTPAEGAALSVAELGPGIYYLEINNAQGRVRHRFVKE